MKKILFMALVLTGIMSLTTACSDDNYDSNLPIYDASDFESRVKQPAWSEAITWYDNADLNALYNSFKSADMTLQNVGYYEYKLGMNYSTGKEQDYWYYYSRSGSSIYVVDGKFYQTNFDDKLADLSWSENARTLYGYVWARYLTRSRLKYTFLVQAEGEFGDKGAINIDGTKYQAVDVTAASVDADGNATPAYLVLTDTENTWQRYKVAGPYTEDEDIMKTTVIEVTNVRQQVLDNLDLVQAFFRSNLVYCPDYGEDDIDLDVIRAALN